MGSTCLLLPLHTLLDYGLCSSTKNHDGNLASNPLSIFWMLDSARLPESLYIPSFLHSYLEFALLLSPSLLDFPVTRLCLCVQINNICSSHHQLDSGSQPGQVFCPASQTVTTLSTTELRLSFPDCHDNLTNLYLCVLCYNF